MADNIKFTIINNRELYELFRDLVPKVQDKIINTGLKNAARQITTQAKRNFKGVKKNKSLTNYRDFNSSFSVREMKSRAGVIAGMKHREGYKYRFINTGTEDREYISKNGVPHKTGRIEKTNFFTDAVDYFKDRAQEKVSEAITKEMEKTVAKYNKKYRL
jgi:hypothetical protein